ncbi:PREDICTED: guanylate kinase-associated protein mars [Drosophila arizonae]|uniref:Guanylate kinase-associated protein mars n=1 Tax=Drosophila arizonae TaxID=7263 RepID=A0ABM1PES2_DROAR|nr:PREDICTED: guanylate kinase-associated protein mars [Drosophila arizonae]
MMENHRNLFKVSSGDLRRQNPIESNREHHRVARSKKREDLFQKNRSTYLSQTPSQATQQKQVKLNNLKMSAANIDQENKVSSQNEFSTNNKMSKRHANYLQRFLKWKSIDKYQASQKNGKGCKQRQALSQPTASFESEKEEKRRSLYVFNNIPKSPLPTAENVEYPDITKVSTVAFSFQQSFEKKPEKSFAPAASHASMTKTSANRTMKSSIARVVKSNQLVDEVNPFVFGAKPQEFKTKLQTKRPALNPLQVAADSIREKPEIQISLKQNRLPAKPTVRSVKSSITQNAVTKPLEVTATKENSRGGRAVQMKALAQRKGVNPLSSELSIRMKAANPHCRQNQIRHKLSTKFDLQEICNLQTPFTSELGAQATCQKKSYKKGANILKSRGDTFNKSTVASRKPNGAPYIAKNQLSPSPSKVLELQNRVDAGKDEITPLSQKNSETLVAVRRILDTVAYFRLQLDNEIKRLHCLCDEWNLYSSQNEERLLETGAKDSIDAAIGQTKLLTSKKFMQFKGLIDRCEAGASGKDRLPNDGSEASKPVFVDDLEGWWDMLRLQSQNVDKRFDNLRRLKENNWIDPDTETLSKVKPKAGPITKRKPATKPSSDLRSFLRKAFAENRKKQATQGIAEESNQSNQTPKRCPQYRHIFVRDRKSFSPVPTVLRVSNGSAKRVSTGVNSLLKSAIIGATEYLAREQLTPTREQPISILKTPGTKRRQSTANRNVIFSAKKKVRRFQFTFEEGNVSGDEVDLRSAKLDDCEEDMSLERVSLQDRQPETSVTSTVEESCTITPRTYSLRNRVIKLRPSSEFM